MSEWINSGISTHISVDGGTFVETLSGFPDGTNFGASYRIGKRSNLEAKRGYVIRAIDFAGDFTGMGSDVTSQMNVFVGAGATRVPYGALISPLRSSVDYDGRLPIPNNQWAINVPDTSVPLGVLREGAGQVNTNQWAGVSSSGIVVNQSGPDGRRPTLARGRFLVSPKPQWLYTAPTAMTEGQTDGVFRMTVRYPDGTPVVGLRLALRMSTNQVAMFYGGANRFSLDVATDSQGVVSVPLRALGGGASALVVSVADARCEADYFSPPLQAILPINAESATVGGRTCVVLPPTAGQAYVPETRTERATFAWDAGAFSILSEAGDCDLTLTEMGKVIGVVLGFVQTTDNVEDYTRISHGLYFFTEHNVAKYSVIEGGRLRTTGVEYSDADTFTLRRARDKVSYIVNGSRVYTSAAALVGTVRAGCSLFATGDRI